MAGRGILIHISDRDKWSSAIKMAGACAASEVPEAQEIVIVADAFAGAVCLACDRLLRTQMENLSAAGHRIVTCELSLRSLNLRPEGLPQFIEPVAVGVLEIVRLQDAGFHYIKI
ncbi:MAG: hypothetical protein AB9873_07300 [Syntrophobacteraceae bacterium]